MAAAARAGLVSGERGPVVMGTDTPATTSTPAPCAPEPYAHIVMRRLMREALRAQSEAGREAGGPTARQEVNPC